MAEIQKIAFGDGDKVPSFIQSKDGSVKILWHKVEAVGAGNIVDLGVIANLGEADVIAEWSFKNRESALVVIESLALVLSRFSRSFVIPMRIRELQEKEDGPKCPTCGGVARDVHSSGLAKCDNGHEWQIAG